jgi:protein-S-isoprenylcysteine O-methyltransferase Ste14
MPMEDKTTRPLRRPNRMTTNRRTLGKHIEAVALLPFMVTVAIPAAILYITGIDRMALDQPAPWSILMLFGAAILLGLGLLLLVTTIRSFERFGRGTLAPWSPTQRLVVVGVYRHVRNPMITGVFCILLAEVLFFGSLAMLGWLAVFVVTNLIYIPLLEEPGLEKRFGGDYSRYKRNVPRWIPRLRPWEGSPPERRS